MGVAGFAIFVAAALLFDKIGGWSQVGATRLVFRGEYKEAKALREGMTFRTSAAVPDIMRELETYVSAVEAPLGYGDVLYVAGRSENAIAWVFGSKTTVKLQVVVGFGTGAEGTEAAFAVTRWLEEDGIVAEVDELKTLRLQVKAAFRAADPAVIITEGLTEEHERARLDGVFETAE